MLSFRIEITPDDNGTVLVTSPDLPEVTTFGEDGQSVIANAVGAIEEALAARISAGQGIPEPAHTPGDRIARLPLLTTVKVLLYVGAKAQGVTRAELSRRLGWHWEQVDRLFRLDHASRLDQLEAAFKALGQEMSIEIRNAA